MITDGKQTSISLSYQPQIADAEKLKFVDATKNTTKNSR